MTLMEMERFIRAQETAFVQKGFEILADKEASVQTVISLLEILRAKGAVRVTLGTVQSAGDSSP